jgi:hypothetical protein
MPGEAYSNPPFIIPVFGYTWSPKTNANGNAQAQGFYQARIGRGKFYNAVPDVNNNNTSRTKVKATGSFNANDVYFPIQNVFRPLQNPSSYISLPPSKTVSIYNVLIGDTLNELSYAVTMPSSKRIASIQLDYSLSVDSKDQTFLDLITDPTDLDNIKKGQFSNIDLNKYLYLDVLLDGKVYTAKSGVESKKLTAIVLDEKEPKYGLPLTGSIVEGNVIYLTSGITTNVTDPQTGVTTKYYFLFTWDNIDYLQPKVSIKGQLVSPEYYQVNAINGSIVFKSTLPNLINSLYEDISIVLDKSPKLLPLTSLSNSPIIKTTNLRFEDSITSGLSASNYPQAKEIKLAPNKKINSLRLDIKKFSIYEAVNACNIDDRNLPSAILSYAILVDCEVDTSSPLTSLFKVPATSDTRPTINVKVFNSDERIQSPGFSHSVDLRFFCASTPIDPGVGSILGAGLFFVTLLNVGVGRKHSRYVFDGTKLNEGIYKLTEFTLYSKKQTLSLTGAGKRNDKDLDDTSLGIFAASDEKYPLPINTGITFTKGTFKTAFNANVTYKDSDANNTNSVNHVYFRYWFVPHDADFTDIEKIKSYREKTEFIFKVVDGVTTVSKESPKSFIDLLVSPPLDDQIQTLQISRFISAQKKLTFTGLDFSSAVLAVEVFIKTNPTTDFEFEKFPKVKFEASSEVSGIESNIFQNISNTLYPMRSFDSSIFTSAIFKSLEAPLILTNLLTGNRPSIESKQGYIQYDKKFTSANSLTKIENAFEDLLVINKESKKGSVNVTLTESIFNLLKKTSQIINSSALINVDFVVDTKSISNGRVNVGTWTINLTCPGIDNDLGYDLQIQGLIISTNGAVLSRLFKSPILTNKTAVTYSPVIKIPFNIESAESHFVLRITLYPFSSGKYKYSELVTASSKEDLKPGFKIDSITINKHTLEYLEVIANDEASGAPGFNEDLPIAPVKVLGNDAEIDSQFFFVASDDSLGTKTVSNTNPYKITGTLYSPTWFVGMPNNSEVKFNSSFAGASSAKILFRSVIGAQAKEDTLSVATSQLSGEINVAYNSSRTNAKETGEIDLLSLSGYSGTYNSTKVNSYSGTGDSLGTAYSAINPEILNFQPINNSSPNADSFYLLSLGSDKNGVFSSSAINSSGANEYSWGLPGSDFYQSGEQFDVSRRLFSGLTFSSTVFDEIRNTTYSLGYITGGSLLLKETQAFLASADDQELGVSNYLVAGPLPEDKNLKYLNLQPYLTNAVAATYPSLVKFKKDNFVIFYVSQNNDSIKYKIIQSKSLSEEGTVFSFPDVLEKKSTKNVITGLTSIYDDARNIIHIVFWCNNKIFYLDFSSFIRTEYNLIPKLQLVAGNFISDKTKNTLVYDLEQKKYIFLRNGVDDYLTDNLDIPKQKPALSLTRIKNGARLTLWYKNNNNQIVSKTIEPYSNVFDKAVYEVISK